MRDGNVEMPNGDLSSSRWAEFYFLSPHVTRCACSVSSHLSEVSIVRGFILNSDDTVVFSLWCHLMIGNGVSGLLRFVALGLVRLGLGLGLMLGLVFYKNSLYDT